MRIHPKRLSQPGQTELDRVLDSLTVPQLQDVGYALKKERSKLGASKEQIIEGLRQGSDVKHLELAAHRVEALAPFKHTFFFSFRPASGGVNNFESDAVRLGQHKGFTALDLGEPTVRQQLILSDAPEQQIYLKLVHAVPTWDLEETGTNEFQRRKFLHRHPLVLLLRYKTSIATLSFPGFTQGAGTPPEERLTYEALTKECCELIEKKHEIRLEGLGIRPALEAVSQETPPEVRVERSRFAIAKAHRIVRMDVDGASEDVRDILSQEFQGSAAAVRTTLTDATVREWRLYWYHLKVQTTLRFHDLAPEMLFLWRLGGASSSHLEYILSRVTPRLASTQEAQDRAATWLRERPVGEVVQPSQLIQSFGLTLDQSQLLLSKAASSRMYALRFRVRTDRNIPGYENRWVLSIKELPAMLIDEEGAEIRLSAPENIELGYMHLQGSNGHAS